MIGLPQLPNRDGIVMRSQVAFGGYNHTLGAGDGELWDMENLTADYYPLLAARKPRYKLRTLATPLGFYGRDGLYWVDGSVMYRDGTAVLTGLDATTEKTITALGAYIIVFPDKKFYNTLSAENGRPATGTLGMTWTGAASIQDGTYAEESAEANTIYAAGVTWTNYFSVGDAVTISGTQFADTPVIVREIDGAYLRFYENTFDASEKGTYAALSLERSVPDMDYVFEHENRLWGCRGDTIYASKLGDPFNFNVFDGLSTDSYAVDVGSAGDFTAGVSFLGYPIFFKSDLIYKMYGDKPSNFQLMSSASLGVEEGSGRSLAIAGEMLFYLSRAGIVAYSGGVPQNISAAFGTDRYANAVGGSDGVKYYVSMEDGAGETSVFVYDTRRGLWHREDSLDVMAWAWDGELYCLDTDGNLWLGGNAETVPAGATAESSVQSMAEFSDFTDYSSYTSRYGANKKRTPKLLLRIELEEGATVQVDIQYDSCGTWTAVRTLSTQTEKRSYYLPLIPHRCDHYRLRLTGTGMWRLYSLAREDYNGSANN